LIKRGRQLTPEEEKAGEIGLSQFNEGAGTQYVTKKKVREDMGTSYARLTESKLSYGGLVMDRVGDFFGDMSGSKSGPVAVKKKLTILGTGWAAHSIIKTIDADTYDVTIISPRNYFVFTPMLAGASTGVVEMRSITGMHVALHQSQPYLHAHTRRTCHASSSQAHDSAYLLTK
jgi:hypothetical protein